MAPEIPDPEIVRQSLSDPSRFEAIYERHLAPVYTYLRRRLGNDAAEDMTAEVFVRAFRGRSRYEARHSTVLPWLFGIASNLIGDQRRAESKRLKTLEQLASKSAGDQSISSEEAYLESTLSPELFRAVRRLAAGDRDALLLVVWGELSYEETAQALGIPVGTVRSRIARARKQLQTSAGIDFRASNEPIAEGGSHA